MLGKITVASAVATMLLVSSPCWSMATVTVPAGKDAQRFTDPARKPQDRTSGSAQIITTNRDGAFGFGGSGSVSVGTPRYLDRSAPDAPLGNSAFPGSSPAYSNFPTYGAAIDPTFGPNGEYAPRFNSKR